MVMRWLRKKLGVAGLEERLAAAEEKLNGLENGREQASGGEMTIPADVIGEWLNGRKP